MVSVIIPTYNRAGILLKTLKQFQKQTFINWECIVIDDGSEDSTEYVVKSLMKEDSRFKFYKRPSDWEKGPSSCRNFGLITALGDLIQFFDDDDLPKEEMLLKKVEAFGSDNIEVVVHPLVQYDLESEEELGINKIYSENLIEDYFTNRISWYVSGPMWRRGFLREQFDPSINLMDDWDFNLRNLLNNPKIVYIKNAEAVYCRRNSLNTLSTFCSTDFVRSEFRAYQKLFHILKLSNNISPTMKNFYLKRLINIFYKVQNVKNHLKFQILEEILKNLTFREGRTFIRLCVGYATYFFFNRGYRFISYKNSGHAR